MQNIDIPEKVLILKSEKKNSIINDKLINLNNKKLLNYEILNEKINKTYTSKINVYCFNYINEQKIIITTTICTDENNIIKKSSIANENMLTSEPHSRKLSLNKRILSIIDNDEPSNVDRRGSTGNIKQSIKKSFSKTNKIKRSYTHDENMSNPNITGNYFSNKYVVLNKLGKGATATIRLVKKRNGDDTVYVAKEFHKKCKAESSKDYLKKITNEYCIGFSLNHENIIKTFDLIEDRDGKWFEILEHCEGGSLYEKINSGKLKDINILNCYFKQLLLGVQYLHSMGVSHRDLKPENILLDNSQQHIKIIDFGVSAVFRSVFDRKIHLIDGLCGSQPYISPEEYNEKSHDGEKIDIWACGVIYYFMMFTEIPWGQACPSDLYYQTFLNKGKDFFPYLNVFTPGALEGLLRMLDSNPKTRITLDELLNSSWIQGIESCGTTDLYKSHGPTPIGLNHRHVILHI